jgi:hypothetical protein
VYEFKPWNECSRSCKHGELVGIQWKYVVIMQEPMHGGDECPMKTARTCNTQACPTTAPTPIPTNFPTLPPTPGDSTPVIHRGAIVLQDVGRYTVDATLDTPTKHTFYSNIRCKDAIWGDLTKSIKKSGVEVVYSKPGVYERVYTCTNPAPWRRSAVYKVLVTVEDKVRPKCLTEGVVNVEASFPFTPTKATCVDNIDGSLKVHTAGIVDVEKAGPYELVYYATDKSGNIGKFVQHINVVDTLKPVIGLQVGVVPIDGGIRSVAGDLGINGEKNPIDSSPELRGYETLYPVRRRLVVAGSIVLSHSGGQAAVAVAIACAAGVVAFIAGQLHHRRPKRDNTLIV